MPTPKDDIWNDDLKFLASCPMCEARYEREQARLLASQGQTRLLHITCGKCQQSILALILVNQAAVSSVGLITDLTSEDVQSFRRQPSVSIDDVITTHNSLEECWLSLTPSFATARRKRHTRVRPSSLDV